MGYKMLTTYVQLMILYNHYLFYPTRPRSSLIPSMQTVRHLMVVDSPKNILENASWPRRVLLKVVRAQSVLLLARVRTERQVVGARLPRKVQRSEMNLQATVLSKSSLARRRVGGDRGMHLYASETKPRKQGCRVCWDGHPQAFDHIARDWVA